LWPTEVVDMFQPRCLSDCDLRKTVTTQCTVVAPATPVLPLFCALAGR
jgi:hypothetical protein